MVPNLQKSRFGQTGNINSLVLVNDEFLICEIEHCCILDRSYQVLKFSLKFYCFLDTHIYRQYVNQGNVFDGKALIYNFSFAESLLY